jgi:3-oxoacyl-[acyl-carrier-protein] synthase II
MPRLCRRVAVTGLGIITSNARNVAEFHHSLREGISGIKEITRFDTGEYRNSRAGVIADFRASEFGVDEALDRASQLALVSAKEAMADADLRLDEPLRNRTAVCLGTSLGGMVSHLQRLREDYEQQGDDSTFLGTWRDVVGVPASQIASLLCEYFDLRGGHASVVTACAAGSNSISIGVDLIRQGRCDVVLASAVDPLTEISLSGFNILMALSRSSSRPFDRNRDGLLVGEGAGTLILEEYERAVARGARIYGEILGYGLSNDGYHPTQPDPEAGGACRAILRALADAGREPGDMDYINAHGTATRYNDLMELKAITSVYGERAFRIPISSIKSMIGHTLGAAGTLEAIATLLALHHKFLPPTINFQSAIEGFDYDFVPHSRPAPGLTTASSHSFGFGGNAACLIFGAHAA